MNKGMTKFPLYETGKHPESARINLDTVTALHSRMLAATAVQKVRESQATHTELVKDEKGSEVGICRWAIVKRHPLRDCHRVGRSRCRDECRSD